MLEDSSDLELAGDYDTEVEELIDSALDAIEETLWNLVDDLEELVLEHVEEDDDDGGITEEGEAV